MRRTAIAAALAALFPVCSLAQTAAGPSSIEMYGLVDLGLERQDVGAASVTRLSSGVASGSRLGIRGREALTPGYAALFTLENRIEADSGAMGGRNPLYFCGTGLCPGIANPTSSALNAALLQAVFTVNSVNALFDRQSYVGVVTPIGAFLLGRQYTPGYEILNKYNSFQDSLSGQFTQGYTTLAIRANNAVHYRIETGGFAASLMYGFGGTDAIRSERSTSPGSGDDFMGVNAQYVAPNFSVGVAHNRNKTVTFAAPTEARTGQVTTNVGATSTFGAVKLFVQYMERENKNPVVRPEDITASPAAVSTQANNGTLYINPWDADLMRGLVGATDTKAYHLGAQWKVGSGTLHFSYNWAKDTARTAWALDDAKIKHYGLGYFHNLSRRTQLYGAYSIVKNDGEARMALGAAGYGGGFTTARNESASAMQLGVRHYF